MRRYMYDDFYEGFLHMLLLILPIAVGALNALSMGKSDTIPVSLIISICGAIYSARNVYKSKEYHSNRRVKIEMIIVLVLLAIALVSTVFKLQQRIAKGIDDTSTDFTWPVIIYSASVLPYLVEGVFTIKRDLDLPCFNKSKSVTTQSKKVFQFDVTSGKIN